MKIPTQTRFPTWSRKVKIQMVSREATKKFSKSKKEKDSKMKKERQRQGFLILIGKVSKCKEESLSI